MRQSTLFTKTRKEAPKDEVSTNAQLLVRAGFIHKEIAGVYSLLPLGLRSIKKIENIIRTEMNTLGGQEVELSALQNREHWEASGRWSDEAMDVWFKTELNSGGQVGLAPTHEEPLSSIMADHIQSYRDLPKYVYQFQTKYRNELRPKSGIMRGREFLMKDLYSFHSVVEDLDVFYEKMSDAYTRIFDVCGIGHLTYKTIASGGSFSKFSHEFQTVSEAGEDIIYVDEARKIAINKEIYGDDILTELGLDRRNIKEHKAIEVGNIFKLGSRFSEPMSLNYTDEASAEHFVIMGSYGIGLGRLLGTVVEVLADDKGMKLPKSIAPFEVHLVSIGSGDKVLAESERIYRLLTEMGVEVLFDDRDKTAGEKLADADLLGLPTRIVISEKTVASDTFEAKDRMTGETSFLTEGELMNLLGR